MVGLLSYLFGQPRGLLAANEGMTSLGTPQPEPYDPRQGQMAGLSQGLLGLGAGIAGGQNWGQGISMGLLGANQGMQQGQQNYQRETLFNQQMAENERANAERARAAAFFGGGQGPSLANSPPGTVVTPGIGQQYASADGATTGSTVPTQLAGMIDDTQWARVQAVFHAFGEGDTGAAAAQQTLQGYLKGRDPVKLGEGEQLLDENNRVIAENAKDIAPTSVQQDYDKAVEQGYQGSLFDYQIELKKAGASSSNTTLNLGGEDNPLMGVWAKGIETLQQSVAGQADIRPRVEQIIGSLESGVETGKLDEALIPLKQWAADLGWADNPGLSQQEALQSAISFIIPRMRVAGSGSTSDPEIKLFGQATAQMGNTPAGNLIIARGMLQIMDAQQRALDAAYNAASKPDFSIADANKAMQDQIGQIFPKPKTPEEYAAIPPGTVYLHPDNGWSVKQ